MLNRSFFLLTALFAGSPLLQAQEILEIDSSRITFVIKNAGFSVEGSFDSLAADIRWNMEQPEKSTIAASFPARTIDTGIRLRDKHLRDSKYFAVEQYPRIRMRSTSIRRISEGEYVGRFELEMKGKSQSLEWPFVLRVNGGDHIFEGSFPLNRRDFDIGGGSITLSNELTVRVWVRAETR